MKISPQKRIRRQTPRKILPGIFLLLLLFSAAFFFVPQAAFAQQLTANLDAVGVGGSLPTTNVIVIIARIIRAFIGVLGIIAVVIVVYAGYLYMFAGSKADQLARAQKILRNGVIGLIIIFLSFSIATFILNKLLAAANLAPQVTTGADGYYEPLSGSLGIGIIESHYPIRNALDIPRNSKIMITFKEPVDPASMISGYSAVSDPFSPSYDPSAPPLSSDLNTDNVHIMKLGPDVSGNYFTLSDPEHPAFVALTDANVIVTFNEDYTIYVFDPVPLLGNSETDTNYIVDLLPGILLADGSAAFAGAFGDGYEWTFEISTEVDLTPPRVQSVIPTPSLDPYAKNIVVQITFDEAMDPVAATGTYDPDAGDTFSNIEIEATDSLGNVTPVTGTYRISNVYQTVEFVPDDACGVDPCGDTIFCLPGVSDIDVQAHAAEVGVEAPQAVLIGYTYNGLVDAASNSLDGDEDGAAVGSPGDDYTWGFSTSADLNDTVPIITALTPGIGEAEVDLDQNVEITFHMEMQSSTLNSTNIQFLPDHVQELWYFVSNEQLLLPLRTKAIISHGVLWPSDPLLVNYNYYPVVTNDVKSAYQICMFPSYGLVNTCATSTAPYCCDGSPSITRCTTVSGDTIGD